MLCGKVQKFLITINLTNYITLHTLRVIQDGPSTRLLNHYTQCTELATANSQERNDQKKKVLR